MNTLRNVLIIFVLFFIASCNDISKNIDGSSYSEAADDNFEDLVELDVPATMQVKAATAPNQTLPDETPLKKVVKTGGIRFKSDDVQSDYQQIIKLLPQYKAYVENENQTKTSYKISYSMTIRVPATAYDTLFTSIVSASGKIESKYSNVEDVTERYYDLKSRIKNKKALELRYIDLLKKAKSIKDILEIERNLNTVRTEIERLQGQFNYLSKQVSFSTIQLDFYQDLPYIYESGDPQGFGDKILNALDSGWQGFLFFLIGITTLWPFLILFVGIIYLIKYWRRRIKKKKAGS
ncbi:MAG: DUF4349 domain-containing protein [Bacteroidota bacterium]